MKKMKLKRHKKAGKLIFPKVEECLMQDHETAIHNGGLVIILVVSKGNDIYEYYSNECFLMEFDLWFYLEWPPSM